MGTRSVKLAKVLGIRIGADPSWFLALFLIILLLGDRFDAVLPAESPTVHWALAVAAALLFFGSLVIHELGHAIAARWFGIQTQGIDLWLLGGVARLSRDARNPKEEFVVAIAGPVGTVVAGGLCVLVGLLLQGDTSLVDAALLREGAHDPLLALFGWAAAVNVVLLVFNLIPAFPLDGGRIARAIAWKISGDRRRGTVVAGGLGRVFAVLLGVYGLVVLMNGDAVSGIWFLLIAWFIGGAARAAVVTSEISEQLHAVTAGELMDEQPAWVPQGATAIEAEDEAFAPFGVPWAAVLSDEGRIVGVVRIERVREELNAGRPGTPVAELLDAGDAPHVGPEATLEELLADERLRELGALPVVGADGTMRGLVSFRSVRDALAQALPGTDLHGQRG